MTLPEQQHFSKIQAARYLGISINKLIRLSDQGFIACYEFMGRRTYKRVDLDQFLEASTQKKWTPHPMKNRKE